MLTRKQQQTLNHAACSAVLETSELLENILSNLDMRSLLTCAQGVNRRWHQVVKDSPLLQRLLYLQPDHGQDSNHDRTANPLLKDAFPAWFGPRPQGPRRTHRTVFTELPMCASQSRKRAFMRAKASWRRMLVTQPPVYKLGCWMSDCVGGELPDDTCWQFKILEFSQGLRMGKLYDLTQRWVGTTDRASFEVLWSPEEYDTLRDFFFYQVDQRRRDALRVCGAAVDVILKGKRWNNPETTSPSEDASFRRRFAYNHNKGEEYLEPSHDSGYKPATQWAIDLDPSQIAQEDD